MLIYEFCCPGTNDIDVELHVKEPDATICNCFTNLTRNGGLLSRDMTGGFGPVEYITKRAIAGSYNIYVKLVAPHLSSQEKYVTCRLRIYSNYGRKHSQQYHVIVTRVGTHLPQVLCHVASISCARI